MLKNLHKKATNNEKSSNKSQRPIFHGNHLVVYCGLYHDQAPDYNFCHGHQGHYTIYQKDSPKILLF
jgi:hypothetical protein